MEQTPETDNPFMLMIDPQQVLRVLNDLVVMPGEREQGIYASMCHCIVHPDGRALILTDGILRTRYREGFSTPTLMTPGEVYRLEIDLVATSKDATTTQRIAELKRLANAFDKKIAPRQQAGAIEKYFKSAAALLRGVIQSTT